MSQQWRVVCESCGKEISGRLRMHTQLSHREAKRRLNEGPRESPESFEGTWVECNNCGRIRQVYE